MIDVWDAKTFDAKLVALLATEAELIRDYMTTDHRLFLSHDLSRGPGKGSILRPDNPHAAAFVALQEAIGKQMQSRTVRAWHYTRLTEPEIEALRRNGIHLSTPATLRARLDALVASRHLDIHLADALYGASPFQSSEQLEVRSNKFWMVSHPVAIGDSDIRRLLSHWGGEVASFWTKDPALLEAVTATGRPCILELAVPIALTRHSYSAGRAVVATFGRTLGCIPDKHAFDLYVAAPLSPDAVLAVHSEGDSSFDAMGRSYPEGYVDVDVGRWKELTGEEC